ncbi:MAG: molybdenum cofactor guanylyltransferase [Dehalococcoidia bacterium]
MAATVRYYRYMAEVRCTGVVLAGGRSSRLGRDKALLELHGETLLARVVRLLSSVVDDIIVLGPPDRAVHAPGARVIPDERPGDGPLPALATALREMYGERMIAVATDMPLLNPALLRHVLDRSAGFDVAVPRVGGRTQQLHGAYGRGCIPVIEAQLQRDDLKVDRFFGAVRTLVIEEDEIASIDPHFLSFRNINTESDWIEVQRIAAGPAEVER